MSASITRESSPPDAVSRSGDAGTPGLGASRKSTRSAPEGPTSSRGSSTISNDAPSIASAVQLRDHALGQLAAPPSARACGELGRQRRALGLRLGGRGDRPLGGHLGVGQPVALGPAALGVLEHRRHRAAVLALEPVVAVQALLDLVQALGIGVEALQVAAQLDAEVLGLDPQRAQPLGQRVHRRVRARDAVGQPLGLGQQRGRAGGVGVVGRDRLRARRPRRRAGRRPRAAGRARPSGRRVLLAGVERLDLVDLEGQQVQVAVARAGALAQLLELAGGLRARARGRRPRGRAAPGARGRRRRRAARAGPRRPSAGGARAGRRRPAAARPAPAGRPRWPTGPGRRRGCGPRR